MIRSMESRLVGLDGSQSLNPYGMCGKYCRLSSNLTEAGMNCKRFTAVGIHFSAAMVALKSDDMNILKIVVALICCYGLFVSVSYLLMRLIFPKIEIQESEEEVKRMRVRQLRRISRPLRRQKNLAF